MRLLLHVSVIYYILQETTATLPLNTLSFCLRPTYPTEDTGGDEGDVEDESELTLDKVEEEMMAEYVDEEEEEEENILHMDDLKDLNKHKV